MQKKQERTLVKMQEYRRNRTVLVKMQEYRRNWTGLWSKCRNTEETGHYFDQNAGIQKKQDRTLIKM